MRPRQLRGELRCHLLELFVQLPDFPFHIGQRRPGNIPNHGVKLLELKAFEEFIRDGVPVMRRHSVCNGLCPCGGNRANGPKPSAALFIQSGFAQNIGQRVQMQLIPVGIMCCQRVKQMDTDVGIPASG